MGAWGEGPLDSDQALDWMYLPARDCALRINDLCKRAEGQETLYGHELRAAGFLFVSMAPHMGSEADSLAFSLADRLTKLLSSGPDWIDAWNDPAAVKSKLQIEISKIIFFAEE